MSDDDPTDPADEREPSIDSLLRAVASETSDRRLVAMLDAEAALARRLIPRAVIAERFRLDRMLRAGGMGVVWAATHVVTGRSVALKFLKTSFATDEISRRRFLQEARAASAVRHPNVVEVIDVFTVDGETPLIVMELLAGETLGERLAREVRLNLELTAGLLLPVVSAVGAAHSYGIVHRDLKPDNIFLLAGAEPTIKVLDFGIAKLTSAALLSDDTAIATGSGAALGTPRYMAPEQLCGDTDLDHRADIWALGAILYECLSGQRAVKASNIAQAALQLAAEGVEPLARVEPQAPRAVCELVDRMLAREPTARPPSLHEVGDTLARYTRVRAPSFGQPAIGSNDRVEPKPRTRVAHRLKRKRALIAAATAISCGLILGAATFYTRRSGRGDPPAPQIASERADVETVLLPVSRPSLDAMPLTTDPTGGAGGVAATPARAVPAPSPARPAGRRARAKKQPPPAPPLTSSEPGTNAPFRGGLAEDVPF